MSDKGPTTQQTLAKIPIGSSVQIECDTEELKFITQLIGVENGKAIIIGMPNIKKLEQEKLNFEQVFYQYRILILRVLGPGVVHAFKSKVLGRFEEGAALLIISYPDQIQTRNLRREARYPCTLTAELVMAQRQYTGVITNISLHGCQLRLIESVEDEEGFSKAKVEETIIELEIHIPFVKSGEKSKAQIRSITKVQDACLVFGMSFVNKPEAVKNFIDSIQLENIPLSLD